MISHRGFSASIVLDGVELEHFQEQIEDDERIKTCWVPSIEGKRWSIVWRNDDGEDAEIASCGHVFVDGKDVASAIMRPKRLTPVERNGAKTSSGRVKPFIFGKLNLTDDDSIASQYDPRARDIGAIRLEIKLVRLGRKVPLKPYDPEEIGPVHEKAKKAGVHGTTFGNPKRIEKSRGVTNAPWDPEDPGPHVTFIFRYRSRDMLQAQGVISKKQKLFLDDEGIEVIDISDDENTANVTSSLTRTSDTPPPPKRGKRAEAGAKHIGRVPPEDDHTDSMETDTRLSQSQDLGMDVGEPMEGLL